MVSSYTQLLERRYGDKLDDDARRVHRLRRRRRQADAAAHQRPARVLARRHARPAIGAGGRQRRAGRGAREPERRHRRRPARLVTNEDCPPSWPIATQLGQLFQNLIANAIKFRGAEPPRVHVARTRAGRPNGSSPCSDNGIGIEPEYFDRIFVIFQRLHVAAEYPGTGIGLAICKSIVGAPRRAHLGRVGARERARRFPSPFPSQRSASSHERRQHVRSSGNPARRGQSRRRAPGARGAAPVQGAQQPPRRRRRRRGDGLPPPRRASTRRRPGPT